MEGLMVRGYLLTIAAGLLYVLAVAAQAGTGPFRWQEGQVLTYRVEHVTAASDVTRDGTSDTKTRLNLMKRWQVLAVDGAGVATLQLSLVTLRLEATTPSGGALVFDSTDPEKSDPHMREELGKFVSAPLALLRLDGQGRVVEVKESKHGPASRFESELPFVLALPPELPREGQTWERSYKITLEPPQGTGEHYDATQNYVCKSVADGAMTVALTTQIKNLPESALDRVPLLQMQPEGEAVFDAKAGRLRSARLHITKELAGHQGEGSSYRFESTYTEEYVERN
jgi:hypothetical protein